MVNGSLHALHIARTEAETERLHSADITRTCFVSFFRRVYEYSLRLMGEWCLASQRKTILFTTLPAIFPPFLPPSLPPSLPPHDPSCGCCCYCCCCCCFSDLRFSASSGKFGRLGHCMERNQLVPRLVEVRESLRATIDFFRYSFRGVFRVFFFFNYLLLFVFHSLLLFRGNV